MITTIIDDKHKEHKIVTKQYKVGLYCIIDNDPAQQFGLDITEEAYHKWLRKHNNWIPDKSSVL